MVFNTYYLRPPPLPDILDNNLAPTPSKKSVPKKTKNKKKKKIIPVYSDDSDIEPIILKTKKN